MSDDLRKSLVGTNIDKQIRMSHFVFIKVRQNVICLGSLELLRRACIHIMINEPWYSLERLHLDILCREALNGALQVW